MSSTKKTSARPTLGAIYIYIYNFHYFIACEHSLGWYYYPYFTNKEIEDHKKLQDLPKVI